MRNVLSFERVLLIEIVLRVRVKLLAFNPIQACKELYEVPGGDQVDGSPPAPVGRPDPDGQCDNLGSVFRIL